jgi:hypothetical protein
MACGAPSILSRLSRYEELVTHGESALFVDISPESIAGGVIRMLEDADLREQISTSGREIVATQADFDRDVHRVEAKYYELSTPIRQRRPGYLRQAWVIGEMALYLLTLDRSLPGSATSGRKA